MSELALQRIEENKRTKDTFLDLSLCAITELPEELFGCTWVETLDLSGNQITDISFLEKLTGLQRLNLSSNQITDISLLEKLTSLQNLDLSRNQITDISFLEKLISLHSLNLSWNQITNISSLERPTSLQNLDLSFNKITDISSLEKLPSLQTLDLTDNPITDISLLEKLPSLQTLYLSHNKITDFSSLEKLTSLQTLDLSFNEITDFSSLEKLPSLQTLDLSNNEITDISFLEKLTGLQTLNLSSNKITDISSLEKLTGLQTLNLNFNQITDISSLEKLTSLQTLNLSINKITDFSFLEKLTGLQTLYLSNNKITDISFLEKLTGLQTLNLSSNQITDISFLEKLTSLQILTLSRNQITDISFLEKLTGLQSLDLGSNQITDFSFLEKLTGLQSLNLSSNKIKLLDDTFLNRLSNLGSLNLRENEIKNIRPEIYNQYNCLEDLKNYFKDSRKESILIYESKVILVGNGRVGKTCLVKKWLDGSFNPDEISTHAIQLRPWELLQLAEDNNLKAVKLNIWDFGGQDIYHATHRFFMRTQALFLLVWDAQTEQKPEQEDEEDKRIRYKNHPLPYWLSYIKAQSSNSPVIVAQSKTGRDGRQKVPLSAEDLTKYNVGETVSIESGKNSANGFPELKGMIENIVDRQITESCTQLPAQWYRVRIKIQSLQEEGEKQLSLADFEKLCSSEELDKSSAGTLLNYLHSSGVFFYQKGIFNNQVVIDQKWAIDAVYALFNRKSGFFRRLHGKGQFTGEDVQEIWKGYTPEEQQLFISFMEQCEICFEVKEEARNKGIPFEERRFIAPQLLPEEKPVKEIAYLFEAGEGIYFKYRHRFLHAAVMQRFIVRTGFLAAHNTMWKEGILIKTDEGAALVEAVTNNNELLVRIKGAKSENLLAKIRNELKEINQDEQGIEESVSLDGQAFVSLQSLKDHRTQNEEIKAENGTWVKASDYRLFLNPDEAIKFDKMKDKPATKLQWELPKIYFSYAWRDEQNEDREKFVSDLYNSLKRESDGKHIIVRDKEDLGYKGSISGFMKEIGRGDIAVVAISDKYLKSEYCMYELHELYLNSNSDLNELLKKVFPVRVENLELKKPKVISDYLKHWYREEKEWEDLVTELATRISPKQQEKYNKIKKIASVIGDFLDLLADINSLTVELLSENDFAEIKKAIEERMKEMNK